MPYDLIIIGAGPAGYIAAERAGAKGLKVLIAERNRLGGVCLNEGCIPSKTLLNAAKHYYYATHGSAYGISVDNAHFDLGQANLLKTSVMNKLRKGVTGLMKKYKVDVVEGDATLSSKNTVSVGEATYQADNILIATGSSPARPPIPGLELPNVVDSTGVLNLEALPKSITIVGGGVIGCEFACFFGSVGVPVTVIEMLPEICPTVDPDVAQLLREELAQKNVSFHTAARVDTITESEVRFSTESGESSAPADLVLVATGRSPNVEGLGLDIIGLDYDRTGIRINEQCETNVPDIWAAGDVTGRTWLAHAGSRMGEVVVNTITGKSDRVRFETIAGVIYTNPEVATVGLTEAQARERGIPVKAGKFPMSANGRFLAEHADGRGITKVIVNSSTGVVIGVHMIGGTCSEMIYGAVLMIETECRVNEIEDIVFPHPTTSEIIRDTVLTMG